MQKYILKDIKNILEENKAVLLYFSANDCSICKVLKPKIEHSLQNNFPLMKTIFIEDSMEISTYFTIFSNPMIVVFFEGKEFKRYGRNISLSLFEEDIERLYKMVF
ncbi:thioredoxin family protein [Aliarcobacter vitoriensis]|uniref:thioredoxin family protein n=1 Tax=Aliarcobacter vitoriensis TaxID=2011099 RepID=UPI003AAFCF5D